MSQPNSTPDTPHGYSTEPCKPEPSCTDMGLSSLALSAKIEQYAQWQAHIRRRYKQSISRDLDSELFDHVHAELTRMQAEITRRDRTAAEVQS